MTGTSADPAGTIRDAGVRAGLTGLFGAGSVAVVGASNDPRKVGYRPVRFLLDHGYPGRIHPVNPGLAECQGLACHRSLSELPEVPDVAVLVVRAALVPAVLAEAGALGVRTVIVISSGFGESGPQGAQIEDRIARIARQHGIALIGPNSVGVVHVPSRLTASFSEALVRGPLRAGRIALVSQSGAFGTVIFAKAQARGLGLHTYVSSGNEAVVGFADYVELLADQPQVSVIGGYIEGLRDGDRFVQVARAARLAGTPLVVMKVGTAESGRRAVLSHTGMLAGDDRAYQAAMRRAGVVRVGDESQLLDVVEAFDTFRSPPRGGRVAVVSMSGGAGVLLSDLVDRHGLTMAELTPQTRQALGDRLPAFASARNPVDLTGQFVTNSDGLAEVLTLVRADPQVDVVIAFTGLSRAEHADWVDGLLGSGGSAPVVCVYPLHGDAERDSLRRAGVPVYEDAPAAVAALSAVIAWSRWVPHDPPPPLDLPDDVGTIDGTVTEERAKALVAAAGIAVPSGRVARTAEEAGAIARDIGGPLVLKASSTALPHKSDAGGVLVDVPVTDAAEAFHRVRAAVAVSRPDLPAPDVLVEQMVPGGLECVIGAVRAAPFGHLVMVGLGGLFVEAMGDVAFGLAPLAESEALEMIQSLRAYPLLRGDRGGTPRDISALAAAVSRVSRLVAGLGDGLAELDLNPVSVRADGCGLVVLDALARAGRDLGTADC